MRIAITGADGQLGSAFMAHLGAEHTLIPLTRATCDLGDPTAADQIAATEADLVIHPAAYTDVDGCARDPARAYQINTLGTHYVVHGCRRLGAPLVYISTNEVFAGDATQPYLEYDQPRPINAYARSKWMGEQVVRELAPAFFIVRVAWLFGGPRNFVRTVLRIAANPPAGGLRMVADEVGSPTYSADVASAVRQLITMDRYGTYHFVNAGFCSRYDFCRAILDRTGFTDLPVTPITLAEFPRASTPPPFTPLENRAGAALGITLRPWEAALDDVLAHL